MNEPAVGQGSFHLDLEHMFCSLMLWHQTCSKANGEQMHIWFLTKVFAFDCPAAGCFLFSLRGCHDPMVASQKMSVLVLLAGLDSMSHFTSVVVRGGWVNR